MFIRRFVAKDMQEAIKKIRKDFGPDAVILDSKMIRSKGVSGLFKKKQVEVVAAFEPNKSKAIDVEKSEYRQEPQDVVKTYNKPVLPELRTPEFALEQQVQKQQLVRPMPVNNTNGSNAVSESIDHVQDEGMIESLRTELTELKSTVQDFTNRIRIADRDITLTFTPEVLQLYNKLVDCDIHEDIAKQIAAQSQEICEKRTAEAAAVAQEIVVDKLGEPAPLRPKQFKQNVILFAGPTGAGKTTTLVKLAGMLTFDQGLSVGLINMDTYRVGAIEHIKIYSEIMNIPMLTAYNAQELAEAVHKLEDKDVVLIDTAGKSARDVTYKQDLEAYLDAIDVDEVFVVISIVTGNKTCKEVIDHYSFIDKYKLIITKLDEVGGWGNAVNIKDYSGKPISYVTMGQEVPSDISLIDPRKLADNIVLGQEVIL